MKQLHLLLLSVIFPSVIFAQVSGGYGGGISQNDNMNKVDVGVEGSPSVIFLHGNEMLKQYNNPTLGFSGGLFFQYNFPKICSFRTSIDFEQKGSIARQTIHLSSGDVKWTTKNKFDYLTMPFLIKASLGNKVKYFAEAGPFVGYLLKEKEVNTYSSTFQDFTEDDTRFFDHFDTGITAGLGLSISVKGNYSFSCELRNSLGLYNISAMKVVNGGTIKTNSINLLFGFSYRFGKRTYIVPA